MKRKIIRKESTEGPFITYARLECCSCHESYYTHTEGRGSIVIPDFIEETEVFPAHCPICDLGAFAMLMTYIKYDLNKEKLHADSTN